jgi:hypothetical protein
MERTRNAWASTQAEERRASAQASLDRESWEIERDLFCPEIPERVTWADCWELPIERRG